MTGTVEIEGVEDGRSAVVDCEAGIEIDEVGIVRVAVPVIIVGALPGKLTGQITVRVDEHEGLVTSNAASTSPGGFGFLCQGEKFEGFGFAGA